MHDVYLPDRAAVSRAYGWTPDGQIVDDEATIIRELAARTLDGATTAELVRDLTARGIPTVTGATWKKPSVALSRTTTAMPAKKIHVDQ